jgi:hypothetical protein
MMDPHAIEVSAALAGVRRRARLLEDSRGGWAWRDLAILPLLALATYLMFSASDEFSNATFGAILLVSGLGAWQHDRLRRRVDALSTLLTEIGYTGEA